MAAISPHGHFTSPIPAPRDQFRIPPASLHPLVSPGSTPHPSVSSSSSILQQSPLSTSHLSTSHLSASHPHQQQKSSLALSCHREKSPDSTPLQLSDAPPKFQSRGNGNGNQIEAGTPEEEGHQHHHHQGRSDHEQRSGSHEEAPLPVATPSNRGTSKTSHTPFKASARRSLSTKTRTSPRKNVWTVAHSPSTQDGASTSSAVPRSAGLSTTPNGASSNRRPVRLGTPRETEAVGVRGTPSGTSTSSKGNVVRSTPSGELPRDVVRSTPSASTGSGGPRGNVVSMTPNGASAGTSGTPGCASQLSPGDAVIARWPADKRWYAATVKSIKGARYSLQFQDGEKGNVAQSQLFPQCMLKREEPVMAGKCEDDPEITGEFLGFDGQAENFSLKTSKGKVLNFDIGRFSISQDTALEYTKASPSARKRLHTSQHQDNLPSAKRRKKAASGCSDALQSTSDDVTVEDFVSSSQNALFQGYTFFMTQRTKEESYTSSPEEKSTLFDKQKMLNHIVNRKGRVLEAYKDERITDGRCFVISDGCCRTHKYLLGLALAIPCVSYKWIEECIEQSSIVEYSTYRLPAGVPHSSNSPIEWVPRERATLLQGVSAHICHPDSSFKEKWGSLLKIAGATVLQKLPSPNKYLKSQAGGDKLVVISDLSVKKFPRSVVDLINVASMKVLGHEWIIQCLIQGHLVDFKHFWIPTPQR